VISHVLLIRSAIAKAWIVRLMVPQGDTDHGDDEYLCFDCADEFTDEATARRVATAMAEGLGVRMEESE
jgi:hypothetical protein